MALDLRRYFSESEFDLAKQFCKSQISVRVMIDTLKFEKFSSVADVLTFSR